MTKRQARAIEELSADFCIPVQDRELDLDELFGGRPVVAEIGFGNGEATAQIAEEHPEIGYLGIEVYSPGIGNLLHELRSRDIDNVRVVRGDAVRIFDRMVPPSSLSGVHVFFPDPWPKKRHHKRRLISPPTVSLIASRLKGGGYLYVVTDWQDYADRIHAVLEAEGSLENANDGFSPPAAWRPKTRFERKAQQAGRVVREVFFRRVS